MDNFQHYVIFTMTEEEVISYLSFDVGPDTLSMIGAYTDEKWRSQGLFTAAFQFLFSSVHVQGITKFGIGFDVPATSEGAGANDAITRWFKTHGPRNTTLKVHFDGKTVTHRTAE
ncbi:hypothetical protein E2K99_22685 [Herbaspirillum huttiense]|uniref:hypothetical protein n=1 Tax=Herbaspirillum huttiense TaxID=863372 RepID=UPI0010655E95|nr:hypothetical protein [Herbaspirillum huttiense]QBP77625.1 hypothetical protein E2K99_22685 [Herbaspirillum huttiense]